MQANQGDKKFNLRISDISCTDLPRIGRFIKRPGSFYLAANLAGVTRRTNVAKRSDKPSWEDFLSFDIEGTEHLMIRIIAQQKLNRDSLVGELLSPIEINSELSYPKKFSEQTLVNRAKNNRRAGAVSFTLERLNYTDTGELMRAQVQLADTGASKLKTGKKSKDVLAVLSQAGQIAKEGDTFYGAWKPLLENVQVVVDIGNELADIHPYARMVWSILSPALKAVAEQQKRDEMISKLLDAMKDAYGFVLLTKPINIENLGQSRRDLIKKLLQQTYDCAWFIRDYTSHGFTERGLDAVTSGHDSIVKQYIDVFGKLKTGFQEESSITVEITAHRTLSVAKTIVDHQLLDDMKCATGLDVPDECLAGTRESILSEIDEWINRPPEEEDRCVYWLHGVAGCGKSAIAATIARRFDAVRRCVSFFFEAPNQADAGPGHLFPTLSRELADLDPRWKISLIGIIKDSWQLRTTTNIKDQFENFIMRPAREFRPVGPILVVIDALDESGSKEGRIRLLQVLCRLGDLKNHGHFRFLVTSRPEEDIQAVFANKLWVFSRDLMDVDVSSTDDDIRRYVDRELSQVRSLIQKWPEKPWIEMLVSRADHLFQWAFVACSFIAGVGESGVYPVQRYIHIRDDPTDSSLNKLDQLYTTVLQGLYGTGPNNDKIPRFRKILGRILAAREPLSLSALTELRPAEEDEYEIESIVCSLESLLWGIDDRDEPIKPLHASFIDFLCDPKRSGDFYIIADSEDIAFAEPSLRVMNKYLRFNICDLETSYIYNRDIEDLPVRVKQNIPQYLSYACRYFAEHLGDRRPDTDVIGLIDSFLREKLLLWLEAMSLLKEISQASVELSALQGWIKKNASDDRLKSFVSDAARFVRVYGGVMEMSTPHIYLSLTAFIPVASPLYKAHSDRCPGGVKISADDGQPVKWTSMVLQIQTPAIAESIKFSHDGQLIAIGFTNNSTWIWDAHNGQQVAGPFEGHKLPVTSIAFSPDSQLIVSGSRDTTVRIWNLHTSQPVATPFEGHFDTVSSVGFSPNGKLIVSGSHDNTLRVWEACSGRLVAGPFEGHSDKVSGVEFSSDSRLVVSGSHDKTVRLWDAHTGQLVAGPFEGHTRAVYSVQFLYESNLVVSSSYDETLRFWDIHTRQLRFMTCIVKDRPQMVGSIAPLPDSKFMIPSNDPTIVLRVWNPAHIDQLTPFSLEGDFNRVALAELSPDGNFIASISIDQTVRVWDLIPSQTATTPFKGHTDEVSSVRFSPDGDLIVSGSNDGTICVWDAYTGRLVSNPFEGHTDLVGSVGFSPDGKLIVSGSDDSTVRIWDTYTGQLVAEPFKGHNDLVVSAGFLPSGKHIFSGSYDNTIQVSDALTGQLVSPPFEGHTGAVLSVGCSPDGKFLASGSEDETIRVWDVNTGNQTISPIKGHTGAVTSVRFSPDGRFIVSGSSDGTVRIWDSYTGEQAARPFEGHTSEICTAEFSPDGRLVVSSSDNEIVYVWDACTGVVTDQLCGQNAAFSPDGKLIVSGSFSNTIRTWKVHYKDCSLTAGESITPKDIDSNFSRNRQLLSHQLGIYTDSSEVDDIGWVLGPAGELLFWIPPSYRQCLYRPSNDLVIGPNPLKLDLSKFVHGPDWHKCFALNRRL